MIVYPFKAQLSTAIGPLTLNTTPAAAAEVIKEKDSARIPVSSYPANTRTPIPSATLKWAHENAIKLSPTTLLSR
jgi:hypothetical protein